MFRITNLKDSEELYDKALAIVKEEFNYPSEENMTVDFAPLFDKSNHHNCYVLLKDELPIGHIGLREVSFDVNGMIFNIAFIGAIAITKEEQGNGYFSSFFKEILEQNKYPLYFLWSDNHDLYKKFSFIPAISLNIFEKHESNKEFAFTKTLLKNLTREEKENILELYKSKDNCAPYRTLESFSLLEKITSSELFIKKENNKITEYFFVSKGADLRNIVHESSFKSEDSLKEALKFFECWTTDSFPHVSSDLVASTLVRTGEINKLSELIAHYTKGIIKLHFIKDNKVEFEFEGKLLKLPIQDFMQGVFGPNQFQELAQFKLQPFFIPGLESI